MLKRGLLCLFLVLAGIPRLGGAAPEAAPPSPGDAVAVAAVDIDTVPLEDRTYTRYLWVVDPEETFQRVFQLHVNLLSREAEMIRFIKTRNPNDLGITVIKPWLWRIDTRDPRWEPGVWENIRDNDYLFHRRVKLVKDVTFKTFWPGGTDKKDGKFYKKQSWNDSHKKGTFVSIGAPWLPTAQLNKLREATYSESPIAGAEWLFVQSARQRNLLRRDDSGLGYYDFLQLKNRDDYFKLIGFRVKDSDVFGREMYAAIDKSGVSPQNRLAFRGLALGGAVWGTLDTDQQKERGIAIDNLRPGEFKHNTEEWYGCLPNRLPGTFLSDDKGVAQNVAPGDTHGLHDSSPLNESVDKSLHTNLACMRCHAGQVLKSFRDDVRKQFQKGQFLVLAATKREVNLEFKRLYLSDIYKALDADRKAFQAAFTEATTLDPEDPKDKGWTAARAAKEYARAFHRYADDEVTLEVAARELGVRRSVFLAALRHWAQPLGLPTLARNSLARFLRKDPLGLSRLTWEDRYAEAQDIVAAYVAATQRGLVK